MKYAGMPHAMWILFGKSFRTHLTTVFHLDASTAKEVAAKAKKKYKEILADVPSFEKGDRFQSNLVNAALLAAFILNMPERPDMDTLTVYYAESMMTKPIKWFCKKYGILSLFRRQRLRSSLYQMRHLRADEKAWALDLTPALCHLDYTMNEVGGANEFVREHTLASGGPYCDCGYKKKK